MICSVATIVAVGLKIRSDFILGVPYGADKTPHWVLVGGITSHGASFRLRYDGDYAATLTVFRVSDGGTVYTYNSSTIEKVIKGLDHVTASTAFQPNTKYRYTLTAGSREVHGTFATPDVVGIPFNFSVVTASCAFSGSKSSIFQEASTAPTESGNRPLFVMHGGDFHYEDLATIDLKKRIAAVDKVLLSPTQASLFQSTALVYMWDDHDWLGNDSTQLGHSEEIIDSALQSYRELFPFYQPLPSQENYNNMSTTSNTSPYHAFTIGTVRFILTDLVSENSGDRIFSAAQMDWFVTELKNSSSYDYVVWLSTKPWIGEFEADNTGWAGHPTERTLISNVIQQYIADEKQNLLVVSGDSHMVAFDDGRNTYYANETKDSNATTAVSFPILQSAPWDNFGSVKGGPYSDGCTTTLYERNNHYSVIDFIFDEQGSCIQINSYSNGYKKIFSKKLCGSLFKPVVATSNQTLYPPYTSEAASQSCSAPPFLSINAYIVFGLSIALLLLLMVAAVLYFSCCEAVSMTILAVVYYAFSLGLALGLHWVTGVKLVDTFYVGLILLIQLAFALCFVVIHGSFSNAVRCGKKSDQSVDIYPEEYPSNKLIRVQVN